MDFFGGWIPILGQWQWLTDLVVQSRLQNNLKFLNYVIGDYDMELIKDSDNRIIFKSAISAPITFFIDTYGRIDKIDAIGSPWNYMINRVEPVDVENFTKSFADKKVVGDPSPHRILDVNISGAHLSIDYGRPSMRGREIFGYLVPLGKVWRTGAGSPTRLTTSADLNLNSTIIPKGSYNLFTIPNDSSWTLIFNTEEEAWGSAYRAEFDFVHVPMEVSKLDATVEKFTIEVSEEGDGGVIKMMWDRTMASTEFKIHK